MRRTLRAVAATAVCMAAIAVPLQSSAQTSTTAQGLTLLTQQREGFDAKPGQTIKGTIRVQNHDSSAHDVSVKLRDWVPEGKNGGSRILEAGPNEKAPEPSPFPLASWITVTPPQQVVQPQQVVEFKYEIKVPNDASPGAHYGAIGFSIENSSVQSSGAAVSFRVYKLLLVNVAGDVTYKAQITSFKFIKRDSVPLDPTDPEGPKGKGHVVLTDVKNLGNSFFVPRDPKVKLYNVFGKKIAEFPFDPDPEQFVLPGTTRQFKTTFAGRRLVGFYRAEVSFTYGAANGPFFQAKAKTSFFVMPPIWWIWLLLILLIALFILWRSRRRIRRAWRALTEN